jgi:hypothetical protein
MVILSGIVQLMGCHAQRQSSADLNSTEKTARTDEISCRGQRFTRFWSLA